MTVIFIQLDQILCCTNKLRIIIKITSQNPFVLLGQLINLLSIVHISHNEPIEERYYNEIPQSIINQDVLEGGCVNLTELLELTLESDVELTDAVRLDENESVVDLVDFHAVDVAQLGLQFVLVGFVGVDVDFFSPCFPVANPVNVFNTILVCGLDINILRFLFCNQAVCFCVENLNTFGPTD